MASSSSPSALAFSSQSWKYHVFLSFRGEDTRKTFVDHLYSALQQQGIYTYKDNETLPRGESIGPSLMKAIEESQIAVIIFSENYADSSWCLDELECIMKCKDTKGQIVMPIFYDVDPFEVRKQKRKYGEAFVKHWLENETKVESWRKALVDASNLSGWEPKHIANGHESKVIKEILDAISQRLQLVTSSANENLIGIGNRMQRLKSELQIESGGVRMIGIWGVGGGENVREESRKNGLEKLQEEILSVVLKQKKLKVRRVEEGRRLIISIKLFCKHAPRGHRCIEDYELLSEDVVSYAGGLPLALTVLGSFLCDKDIHEWRSALARLKEIPDTDIVEKLKISFDGLKPIEKELFLDIACFFRRELKDKTMEKLDACGFHPVIGIKVLIQKALITISDGLFDMHDLIQEMAHYIVRGEHPNNPAKHSRLWKKEDVLRIFAMDATMKLDNIEAIKFWDATDEELQHFVHVAANMKKLRLISLRTEESIETTRPLPENFPPRELCCLRLQGLKQKQLWEGYKYLPNLKNMELIALEKLIVTPDFDGLPNLERLTLTECYCLEEVHPSIGHLDSLVALCIIDASCLKLFPHITQLKKLETLIFLDCFQNFKPSAFQQQNNSSIPHLQLDNGGKEVGSYKESVTNSLVTCWRCGLSNLPGVKCCLEEPCLPHNNIELRFSYKGLCKLNLSGCELGDEYIGSCVWELPNLQELSLAANNFSRLNFSLLQLPRLKWLNLAACFNLAELSGLPSSIAVVIADGCSSLESFGNISNCKWLWKVSLLGDNKLYGDILLHYMLQGNAIEDHFISLSLEHQMIPKGVVVRGKTFTLNLPDNWYNDFCGFLVHIVTDIECPKVTIIIMEKVDDEDSRFEALKESNEAMDPEYINGTTTSIGYVSFNSLKHTTWSNSSYNMISFSLEETYRNPDAVESYIGAALIPRKGKGDEVQTTDCSGFWDKERTIHEKTFRIQHDSKSPVKIIWHPFNWY
ncbi:unnamed protein product [Lactuca virosa]|uniref:TIR domain-containing protein n=1 Tax=Lactuca virosa TaxID=75947 RepID=A0AAU9N005_9ASTR|nr:unnamed protein product [Lactuca virosa]